MRHQKPLQKKEPSTPKEDEPIVLPEGWQWRCQHCSADLFGVVEDGVLRIKYKSREMDLTFGSLTARCRRCNATSTLDFRTHKINTAITPDDDRPPKVLATKAAQKLATTAGISLEDVIPKGGDKVTVDDVRDYLKRLEDLL